MDAVDTYDDEEFETYEEQEGQHVSQSAPGKDTAQLDQESLVAFVHGVEAEVMAVLEANAPMSAAAAAGAVGHHLPFPWPDSGGGSAVSPGPSPAAATASPRPGVAFVAVAPTTGRVLVGYDKSSCTAFTPGSRLCVWDPNREGRQQHRSAASAVAAAAAAVAGGGRGAGLPSSLAVAPPPKGMLRQLACAAEVCCGAWGPGPGASAHVAFGGCREGGIVCWDLHRGGSSWVAAAARVASAAAGVGVSSSKSIDSMRALRPACATEFDDDFAAADGIVALAAIPGSEGVGSGANGAGERRRRRRHHHHHGDIGMSRVLAEEGEEEEGGLLWQPAAAGGGSWCQLLSLSQGGVVTVWDVEACGAGFAGTNSDAMGASNGSNSSSFAGVGMGGGGGGGGGGGVSTSMGPHADTYDFGVRVGSAVRLVRVAAGVPIGGLQPIVRLGGPLRDAAAFLDTGGSRGGAHTSDDGGGGIGRALLGMGSPLATAAPHHHHHHHQQQQQNKQQLPPGAAAGCDRLGSIASALLVGASALACDPRGDAPGEFVVAAGRGTVLRGAVLDQPQAGPKAYTVPLTDHALLPPLTDVSSSQQQLGQHWEAMATLYPSALPLLLAPPAAVTGVAYSPHVPGLFAATYGAGMGALALFSTASAGPLLLLQGLVPCDSLESARWLPSRPGALLLLDSDGFVHLLDLLPPHEQTLGEAAAPATPAVALVFPPILSGSPKAVAIEVQAPLPAQGSADVAVIGAADGSVHLSPIPFPDLSHQPSRQNTEQRAQALAVLLGLVG